MEDLSHWDFAEYFSPSDAAWLIAGKEPNSVENLRCMTPIYSRMELAYKSAENKIAEAASWRTDDSKELKTSLYLFDMNSKDLHTSIIFTARRYPEKYILEKYYSNNKLYSFESATFSRNEIDRWLKASRYTQVSPCVKLQIA